jgi:phosphoribosylglycinamide formyltransferase 1
LSSLPIRGTLDLSDKSSVSQRIDELQRVYGRLCAIEDASGPIDLIVLAFRKVLIGPVLERFGSRTINVHPSDLSVHNIADRKRRYTGIGGLVQAIMDGNRETRTSIHRIDSGIDTGKLLCLGPFVTFKGDRSRSEDIDRHEHHQKDMSDKIALRHVLDRWVHDDLGVCSILS